MAERKRIAGFLVEICTEIRSGGLVGDSTRSAAGGYRLSRAPEEITLADVVAVFERAEGPAACAVAEFAIGARAGGDFVGTWAACAARFWNR